jgi:hypothetical protein
MSTANTVRNQITNATWSARKTKEECVELAGEIAFSI